MKRFFSRLIALSSVCLLLSDLRAEVREFTSTDGKKIQAQVVSIQGNQVVLAMGSKQYTLEMARFSEADQQYFTQWKENEAKNRIPDLEVDVSSGKSNRSDKNDDFDDRVGAFQFSISIMNDERGFDLEGAKAELFVIGENCAERNKYSVMQTNRFDLSIAEGDTFRWEGNELSYRFDDSEPSRWGHDYYGYVFRIKNSSGKVIYTKTLPKKFEGDEEKIFAFAVNTGFDSDMRSLGRVGTYNN